LDTAEVLSQFNKPPIAQGNNSNPNPETARITV